ncbi:MAG: sugar ABC transporter ATP-binding protein, partial [Clostridia bacterium]|nr:sugar ABC transporter ATP-binding protein [Clostridia bacterium]
MSNMRKGYLLDMQGITKEFPGVRALDGVDLKIRPGTVHALMGENGAGKSTLMKCLFGIYKKDGGTILLDGNAVEFKSPKDALENGVAMVHQELNQALKRNVMDNIWLGRYPKTAGFIVSERQMLQQTKKIFEELGVDVDVRQIMSRLPVAKRQMVEIAKAVSHDCKLLVLDEPTAALTQPEVEELFKIMEDARRPLIFFKRLISFARHRSPVPKRHS